MPAMRTPVIDSHFHAWQPARGDYGWLTPQLAPLYRDVTVADWLAQARPHGVTGGVLVQAAPTEAETAFLLELAEADPAVLGVVGWVDLLAADAPQRIARLAKHVKLKGLRPMLQDIADPDWVLQRGLDPRLQRDGRTQPGVRRARQARAPAAHRDAGAAPSLVCASSSTTAPSPTSRARNGSPGPDGLARIAMQTTADCKLSGLLTEGGCQAAAGRGTALGRTRAGLLRHAPRTLGQRLAGARTRGGLRGLVARGAGPARTAAAG